MEMWQSMEVVEKAAQLVLAKQVVAVVELRFVKQAQMWSPQARVAVHR